MKNERVNWSEGMFLRPHHFQAAARYFDERINTGEQWDTPYNYGLKSIQINQEAIANYYVEVTACEARMPDGTIVDLGIGQSPDRVEIREDIHGPQLAAAELQTAFAEETVVRIFLGLPRLMLGRANVGQRGQADNLRYLENELEYPDEGQGGNEQAVSFRDLNLKILTSRQDGYDLLPIMQIKRSGDATATPVIDEDYFPPLLSIDAWPALGIDIIRTIYDFLGQQQERIAKSLVDRSVSLATQDPANVDLIHRLHWLNEALSVLRYLTFSKGVHPFRAYMELCRLVAKLGILTKTRRMEEAPLYDHDNLCTVFNWFKTQIEGIFFAPDEAPFEFVYFEGYGRGMQVTLRPKWLLGEWDWYVGVARGELPERDCRMLLEEGSLNWKMGSASKVDFYFQRLARGLALKELPQTPQNLPTSGGWIFYSVDKQTHEFKEVLEEQTLAVRFSTTKDTTELTMNQDWNERKGQRGLIINYQGKQCVLEFALFAVRRS